MRQTDKHTCELNRRRWGMGQREVPNYRCLKNRKKRGVHIKFSYLELNFYGVVRCYDSGSININITWLAMENKRAHRGYNWCVTGKSNGFSLRCVLETVSSAFLPNALFLNWNGSAAKFKPINHGPKSSWVWLIASCSRKIASRDMLIEPRTLQICRGLEAHN